MATSCQELRAANWHKGDKTQISAPLIVDPTSGELTQKLKETCRKFQIASNIKVTVRERAGISVKTDAKSEPLRSKSCGRVDCLCCSKGKPGKCEQNSAGYRIKCESCLGAGKFAYYEGETGRNSYSRGLEHQRDLKDEKEDSPLWKHCVLEHDGQKQTFIMKALRSFKSCLQRQVNEVVRISSSKTEIIVLNSKNEFHQAPIIRVVTASGLHGSQGEDQAPAIFDVGGRGAGRGAGRGIGRGTGRGAGRGAERGAGRGAGRAAGALLLSQKPNLNSNLTLVFQSLFSMLWIPFLLSFCCQI